MSKLLKVTVLCCMLLYAYSITKAQNNDAAYAPGELIVKFKDGYTAAKTNHLATKIQAKTVDKMSNTNLQLWKVEQANAQLDIMELVEQYKDNHDIEFIEPNYYYYLNNDEIADDVDFDKQWALNNTGEEIRGNVAVAGADIDALKGWEIQSESPSIVVGILDTGVDWRHPDLIDNIWQNLAEDADGDGRVLEYDTLLGRWDFDPDDIDTIDNDNNGYIDDFIGWNFINNNNRLFDYYAQHIGEFVQSHGTHVAGIIGATGNEQGISGVTRNVQLAPLKIAPDYRSPKITTWHAIKAIEYADTMGFQLSNSSWGGVNNWDPLANALKNAINKAGENNHLFITSAGNGGWDKIGDNSPFYFPAGYSCENIIAVANTDYTDQLNLSSNYNIDIIDIAAPGTAIYSYLPYNYKLNEPVYGYKSGTSMAAPMVAGACALLWEKANEVFAKDSVEIKATLVKNLVLENTDELPHLKGKIATGGRLNIHKALSAVIDTAYTNKYIGCRKRDSLTLSIVYEALGSFIHDYYGAWGENGKPMDEWYGVELNSLGCVTELKIDYSDIKPKLTEPLIPAAIGQLSDLTLLSIGKLHGYTIWRYDTHTDKVIDEYENYIGIIDANTGENEFDVTLPLEIFKLKKLKQLSIAGCKLKGPIPPEIAQLENLEYLDLSYNFFTGNLPPELFDLIKLKRINLSLNQLEGALTNSIEKLLNLEDLQLVHNNLSGNIPTSISNVPLKLIDLGYNNFSGSIPDVFNSLRSTLWYLYLDHNNLSGPIPPSLSNFVSPDEVDGLDLSNNNLSGCYDPALIEMGGFSFSTDTRWSPWKNRQISDGNNFDVAWEDFEADETMGSCWASATTMVWPGDMNNDGKVTVDDIVYFKVADKNEGPTRNNDDLGYEETVNWEGKLGLDWEVAVYGVNGKHQDANGDGIINIADYQVIINNLGKINPDHYAAEELHYYANGVAMVLRLLASESSDNQKVFELKLNNTNGGGPINFNTVSAEMQFNETVESVDMEFINNCIIDSLSTKTFDNTNNKFSYAISKADFVNCDDALAKIIIIMQEEAIEEGDKFLSFKINSINSEAGITINETAGTNSSNSISLNSNEAMFIQLSTTPEICKAGGTATAIVSGGQPFYTYYWEKENDSHWNTVITTEPTIADLTTGTYTLTVIDGDGAAQSISFEVVYALQFDDNGVPIECLEEVEPKCLDDLILEGDISQDTYKADKKICTDGNITEGAEVEFKAGDIIQLDPGFKMESNTQLQIKIEDCSEE